MTAVAVGKHQFKASWCQEFVSAEASGGATTEDAGSGTVIPWAGICEQTEPHTVMSVCNAVHASSPRSHITVQDKCQADV